MNELVRILRLGRSGRGRLALAVLAGVGATGAAVALAGVSAWLIARAAERPPVLYLMVAIVAVRAFGLSRGLLRYLERLAGHDAAFRVLADVRATVVDRLARLLPGGARGMSRGEMSARFVGDVDGLLDLWVRVLLPGAVAGVVAVASVIAMVLILPVAGVVLAATLVLAGVVAPAVASRWSAVAQRTIAPDRGEYQRRVLEVLDGAAELTVLGRLDEHLDELDRLDRSLRSAEARTSFAAGIGSALAVAAAGAAIIGSLRFGAAAIERGDLGGPAFAVIVLLPFAVHEAVGALAPVAAALPGVRVAARRVCEVLDAPDPVVEPAVSAELPDGPIGLEIRGLRAGWPGGPTVLDGVDLTVAAGSTVAIVGPSGQGKSTLAAALMRFIDPSAGTISITGEGRSVDTSTVVGDDLRRDIGWCTQDAHVFDSTLRANLVLADPGADDGAIIAAVNGARLGEFVASLPAGLDTMVGEHGRALSGGERQRLGLARLLLADPRIVVFDEPTEHLDDDTARAVMHDLLDATAGRTVIVITHRTDLLRGVDRVVELRDGCIVDGLQPAHTGADLACGARADAGVPIA